MTGIDTVRGSIGVNDPSQPHRWMEGKSLVTVGKFTYGYEHLSILQWGEGASLQIGNFCSIARDVTVFLGGDHRVDWATTFPFGHIFQEQLGGRAIVGHPATKGDVKIGNDVWIGRGVTIMSGVKIGDGAVIAANSHVVRDVAPYAIVGGNPAREIRLRFTPDLVDLLQSLAWWELPMDMIAEMAPVLSGVPTYAVLTDLIKKYRPQSSHGSIDTKNQCVSGIIRSVGPPMPLGASAVVPD